MELVIFCGLQAAGKSTFYARRFAETHALVSKDLLHNNKRPERRQQQLIREALVAGRSVVVDNTNPTIEDRARLIALGREYGAQIVGYFFLADREASRTRNAAREGKARVPPVAIYATAKRLMPLTYAEGFDRLSTVRIVPASAAAPDGFEVRVITPPGTLAAPSAEDSTLEPG